MLQTMKIIDVTFFKYLYPLLMNKISSQKVVMAGDFNITLEKKDKKDGINRESESINLLKSLWREQSMIDIWRYKHPDISLFTRRRKTPKVMFRLDYK